MVRVRYAPSPTGSPHVGNIRTALFNWLFARAQGGKFLVRIEDTDRNRFVPGSEEDILLALRWLGLDWDEGPEVGGPYSPYKQSERAELYRETAHRLVDEGKAYKCFCTSERLAEMRKEQEAAKTAIGYDRRCRRMSKEDTAAREANGEAYVIRFAMPLEGVTSYYDLVHKKEVEFKNVLTDDFVMLKSDGFPTYHLANIVDDHLMEITHVMRADEWMSSMPRHVQLYRALGWEPPKFAHLPLLMGPDGQKLSKRHGTVQFTEFIGEGYLPDAMFNFLTLCGWSPGDDREIMSREEILSLFSLDRILDRPAVFHHDKLKWMNGHYIREMSLEQYMSATLPYLQKEGVLPAELDAETRAYAERVLPLEQEKLRLLGEITELTCFFFEEPKSYDEKAVAKWFGETHISQMLDALIQRFHALENFTPEETERVIREVIAWLGVPNGHVIHPTRVALSGRATGPSLFDMIAALGKERVVRRLEKAKQMVRV